MDSESQIIAASHVIQQAVAPVFLLTGIGSLLGVLTNRLARIVDRLRALSARQPTTPDSDAPDDHERRAGRKPTPDEAAVLTRRRAWIHWAIILCTTSALLVCVVIATLFLGAEFGTNTSRVVGLLFVMAMASLIAGLLCFLHEIALATKMFETRYGTTDRSASVR